MEATSRARARAGAAPIRCAHELLGALDQAFKFFVHFGL
jgi:hypothetical protein